MSEYLFGVSRGPARLGKHYNAVEKIANLHEATVVECEVPGTGYQRWFAGPNRGEPFDRKMAVAVAADLAAAGLGWVIP
jgi:hypothetical protein